MKIKAVKAEEKLEKFLHSILFFKVLRFLFGKTNRKFRLPLGSMKNHGDHYAENRESDLGEIERTRKELALAFDVARARTRGISKAACEGTREKGWTVRVSR